MVLFLGLATALSTFLGGILALKRQDKLHLILGFSAGAVIGVAFFDLMPEAIGLAGSKYPVSTVTAMMAVGFLIFTVLNHLFLLHPHSEEGDDECGNQSHRQESQGLGVASLCVHSFLDGIGIGLAFQVSPTVGIVVAAAVLAHDFSDGINTVSLALRSDNSSSHAFRWLAIDAAAPFLGILSTRLFTVPDSSLGLILAVFCGFFLYIGASDLLPESHHRHPKFITSVMTVLGSGVIYIAIHAAQL